MADTPTPGNPGTYLPIPGQANLTPDQINDALIKSRNTVPTEGASSQNDTRFKEGTNDGKIYTGPSTPIVDATIQKVQEFTDTATQAKGPKGDKGDKGDTGARGIPGVNGTSGLDGQPGATGKDGKDGINGAQGLPGKDGVNGINGLNGKDAVVDYDVIRAMIQEMLDAQLNFKTLQFVKPVPTSVFGTKSISLPVEIVDSQANTSTAVVGSFILAIPSAGTLSGNVFTAADVQIDTVLGVTANYTDAKGKNYTAQTSITVKALKVSSLNVTGPSNINSAGSGTYAAVATYTDGTTKTVTTDANTTWSIGSGTIGTMNKNVLTAPVVSSNASGTVKAVYVEKSASYTGTANVTIAAPSLKPYYGSAAHPVSATNAEPSAYANWSAFVTSLPGIASNSSKVNTFTINQAAGQYGWYAYPKSFGLMTQDKIKGNGQPGPGGWDSAQAPNGRTGSFWGASGPLEITVTINGSDVPFYLYRTDNVAVSDTWVVTA